MRTRTSPTSTTDTITTATATTAEHGLKSSLSERFARFSAAAVQDDAR